MYPPTDSFLRAQLSRYKNIINLYPHTDNIGCEKVRELLIYTRIIITLIDS